MNSLNKVYLIGFVGKDVEVKTFSNGGKLAMTSLATTDHWKDKNTGEKKSQTEWHNLVFNNSFRKLADFAESNIKKGNPIWIEGSLKTRNWENQEGKMQYMTEIHVREVGSFSGNNSQRQEESQKNQNQVPSQDEEEEDQLPF